VKTAFGNVRIEYGVLVVTSSMVAFGKDLGKVQKRRRFIGEFKSMLAFLFIVDFDRLA